MRRVSGDTGPIGVAITNWEAGSQAFAAAFAELLKANQSAENPAPTPTAGHPSFARTFLHVARKHKLIDENPFCEVKIPTANVSARQRFIDRDMVQKLLDAANPRWRTIIALARYGGLRCPSEVLSLEWRHVDWECSRLTVPSPKTDRFSGKESRTIPLFPELRTYLEEAFELAEPGQTHVIGGDHLAKATRPTGWKSCNLRTTFGKLVKRAGLEPWPRLFHNLRSSRETELLEEFPVHVVAMWMGHDAKVSLKHYAQTTDEHFERATRAAKSGAVGSGGEWWRLAGRRHKLRRGGHLCHPVRFIATYCTCVKRRGRDSNPRRSL
jgi:integrase